MKINKNITVYLSTHLRNAFRVLSEQKSWQSEWHPTHLLDILYIARSVERFNNLFSVVRLYWNGDICIFKGDRAPSAEFGDIGSASARHKQPMCTSQQNKNKCQQNKNKLHLKTKRITIKIEAYSNLIYSNLYNSKIAINYKAVLLFWIRSISIWNAFEILDRPLKIKEHIVLLI